jgi:decaprenylphospho-beta-D-ribofuranose 2-oxidase
MKVTNWGKYPVIDANFKSFTSIDELQSIVKNSDQLVARGLGRCYGDSALSQNIVSTLKYNRILAFDERTEQVTCESGVSLAEIIEAFVPRGWFLPVTPGTKFVTVGGAIASDVHGKNHHIEGSFSNHVTSIDILLSDGSIATCSKTNNSSLFWATCGGMGLTGIILQATFSLKRIESAYIKQKTIKVSNLDAVMEAFEASESYTYSVAWIDCLARGKSQGRSILTLGEHAILPDLKPGTPPLQLPKKLKLAVPLDFPSFALNSLSVKAFNFLYYHKAPDKSTESIIDYDAFFYPLDNIHHWNRIYGKRGFTQYQFVLPRESSKAGLKEILNRISRSGQGSFLAVLKLFGKQDNLISFPKEGYTLALDFAINNKVFPLLDELDKIVLEHGGRLYLTKDVRMNAETFRKSYGNSETFIQLKHQLDPTNKFHSLQSQRLQI